MMEEASQPPSPEPTTLQPENEASAEVDEVQTRFSVTP